MRTGDDHVYGSTGIPSVVQNGGEKQVCHRLKQDKHALQVTESVLNYEGLYSVHVLGNEVGCHRATQGNAVDDQILWVNGVHTLFQQEFQGPLSWLLVNQK